MGRFLSFGLGLLVITVVGASLIGLRPVKAAPASSPAAAPLAQGGDTSPCVPVYTKVAYPSVILLGEKVGITLTVKAVCAGEQLPIHIVLVLDASGSMAGTPNRQMKQAAATLVRGLQLEDYPSTRVGVVEFNSVARTLAYLTNSEGQVISAINQVGASDGSAIDTGIREGVTVLRNGRGSEDDSTEVMVVLSDGANDAGCDPVLAAARQAKSQGVLMIAICVSSGGDAECMRDVASSRRYFLEFGRDGTGLIAVFQQIRDHLISVNLKHLLVKDTLSDSVAYVKDSARPRPAGPDVVTNWIEWEDVDVTQDGVTYTLEVRPTRAGYMPTNQEGWGQLTDSKGRTREWYFQVPWVTVLSPVPFLRTVTPPPTPISTRTAAPTASATATSMPKRPFVFLPSALRERR